MFQDTKAGYALVLLAFATCFSFVGCGDASSPESMIADSNKTNLQRMSNLYVRYQTMNKWKGPETEAALRQFINELNDTTLERMGIEPGTTDDIFVSERDNQPFKIRYGVKGSSRGSNEAIIFEATGVDGVRQVGFSSAAVEDVSDASRYDGLFSGTVKGDAVNMGDLPGGR